MGTSAALRMVPDEVILPISRLGVLQRLGLIAHAVMGDGTVIIPSGPAALRSHAVQHISGLPVIAVV